MKAGMFLVISSAALIFSCAAPVHQNPTTQEQRAEEHRRRYERADSLISVGIIKFTGGDGSSQENAIRIDGAKSGSEGIPAEYIYISKKHGNRDVDWKLQGQSLLGDKWKSYDLVEIEIQETKTIIGYYFDITDFFGK